MADDVFDAAWRKLEDFSPLGAFGRVTAVSGLVLRAVLPRARMGDQVHVGGEGEQRILAEVVGFSGDDVLLMPLGEITGIGPNSRVETTGKPPALRCGEALLGRVIDGLGQPADGRPLDEAGLVPWAVHRPCPDPLRRPRIARPLRLGVRVIDGLLTLGEGQRIGLFAGSGVGKSTLLGQIARQADADVCVVCLVGERGREVREFLDDALGQDGLARSVVVCATSDQPPLLRLHAAQVATATAEYFREQGKRVLLLVDSITRHARAAREVALAAGELPARRGFPPSVFSQLPRLLERTGTSERGSITAIYTVLVEGGDMDEPVADEVRGILDGHIVLGRELAQRGQFPAVDVLASLSRVMPVVTDKNQQAAAARLRELLAAYERQRDLILLGAYKAGSDQATDTAIARREAIERFLRQAPHENAPWHETRATLAALAG